MSRHPRMVASTEGMEGAGKTWLAFENTPRPMHYLDFDFGSEGVAPNLDGVIHKQYNLLSSVGLSEQQEKQVIREQIKKFIADWKEALAQGTRLIVADTFTAAWAGQRIARSEDKYAEYEEEFQSLVRGVYASERTSVLLIHHMKPDWKRDTSGKSYKAGTYSRDGMDGVLTMVQLGIRQRFVQPKDGQAGRFEMDVLKCRDNNSLVGQTFPAMDWPTLCGLAAPSIDWSK